MTQQMAMRLINLQPAALKTEKTKYVMLPLIKGAAVNFECRLKKEVEAGDHNIFIGKVLTVYC